MDDITSDAAWVLQPFQRGEPAFYVEHLKRAVETAAAVEPALLVISGGYTRRAAGPLSEAQSYLTIARLLDWFGHPRVAERTVLEDRSRDSFENLLFSFCRFKQHTGRYPDRVTVVSWAFKQERFNLHRTAIGLPARGYTFLGVNNPPDLEAALAGERATLAQFRTDPFGVGEVLSAKRRERNPFGRS